MTSEETQSETPEARPGRDRRKWLELLAVFGIAFLGSSMAATIAPPSGFLQGLPAAFRLGLKAMPALVLVGAGMWFASRTDVHVMVLFRSWLDNRLDKATAMRALRVAFGAGALMALASTVQIGVVRLLYGAGPKEIPASVKAARELLHHLMQERGAYYRLGAVVVGASMFEEVLFRLFILTMLLWLLGKFWRAPGGARASGATWAALVIAGLIFGFAHTMGGESAIWWKPWYVQLALDSRSWVGIGLGYIFLKYGLETSILTHLSLNLFVPLLFSVFFALHGVAAPIP